MIIRAYQSLSGKERELRESERLIKIQLSLLKENLDTPNFNPTD